MPTSLGPAEILVILVVALIVLGPKRLPEAGRQVGRAIAEVRKWSQGFQDEIRNTVGFDPNPPSYPTPPPPPTTSSPQMPPSVPGSRPDGEVSSPAAQGTVTTGSHGLVSGPVPTDHGPNRAGNGDAPADRAPSDPSAPPAGEPPRT